jgi:hypothetical protein
MSKRKTRFTVIGVGNREWLKIAYNADGENLFESIHNQPSYRGIKLQQLYPIII